MKLFLNKSQKKAKLLLVPAELTNCYFVHICKYLEEKIQYKNSY